MGLIKGDTRSVDDANMSMGLVSLCTVVSRSCEGVVRENSRVQFKVPYTTAMQRI